MNVEKIPVNGHYVWVDKDAEISGYCVANGPTYDNTIVTYMLSPCPPPYVSNKSILTKIVAASPELHLEGVPSYVEWLADNWSVDSNNVHPADSYIAKESFIKGYETAEKEISESKWNEGYKTAIEVINTLPTWDDVRKGIWLAQTVKDYGDYKPYTEEEIIEQLKQGKR